MATVATPPPVLAGQRVALTGTLASMTHHDAAELIRQHGGQAVDHVGRSTTLLVIGEEGWPLDSDGRISVKLREAESLRQSGGGLRLAAESEWLRMIGLQEEESLQRLYTPAMLSRLLDLSPNLVRRWERLGLLRPVRKVGRLPYFDFREVTRLRRISDLLAAGVPKSQLEESLRSLQELPESLAAADQLELLSGSRTLVVRDESGLIHVGTRQRVLDFEEPSVGGEVDSVPFQRRSEPRTAVDWYEQACDRYEAGDLAAAESSLRAALRERPEQPEFHFQLAETLYRLGEADRALERYLVATDWDPEYVEAWSQIGALHLDRQEPTQAKAALEQALDLSDDFADGHFHLGEAMHELGELAAARRHLRRYLTLESRGPWAELARQKLEVLDRDDEPPF